MVLSCSFLIFVLSYIIISAFICDRIFLYIILKVLGFRDCKISSNELVIVLYWICFVYL